MNEALPRVWFLRPLEVIGSIRAGFAIALALEAVGAVAVLAAGDTSPLRARLAVGFPIWIGYSLAFAPVVLARLIREVRELEGIDRFSVPRQIAASAVGVAMHALMAMLSPTVAEGAYPPLVWLVHVESLLGWVVPSPSASSSSERSGAYVNVGVSLIQTSSKLLRSRRLGEPELCLLSTSVAVS